MSLIIDAGNPTPPAAPDRWTPRLNGEVFCSPACGGKCKRADFELATERANTLANQLGSGWEPHVWENLGWHFNATRRGATVSIDRDGMYDASVRFRMDESTELCVSETRSHPREAVEAVIHVLNNRIAVLNRALLSLSLSPLEIQDV